MNLKPDPSDGEGKRPEPPAAKGTTPAPDSGAIPRRSSPVEFDFFAAANDPKQPAARERATPAAPTGMRSTVEPETPRTASSSSVPPARPAAAPGVTFIPAPNPAPASVPPAAKPAAATPPPQAAAPAAKPAPTPVPSPTPSASRPEPRATPIPESRPMPTPQSMDDFRRNADRQSQEQKSFGNVLTTITYTILVAFILVTALAGYGASILFKRVNTQGASIAEIDKRYEAEVLSLKEDLKRSDAEIHRISDDLARQQDQISRLRALADKTTNDLAAEKAGRAHDEAALRSQIEQLGGGNPPRAR
jgi:hypothetical protein